MRFRISNRRPDGSAPADENARTRRLSRTRAAARTPSPSTVTSTPSPSPRPIVTSFLSSSATARQSNPGPRLAADAGADTCIRSGTDWLRAQRQLLEALDVGRAADDLGPLGTGDVGILEPVAGEDADDGRARFDEPVGDRLDERRNGGCRRRLAEDALLLGQKPICAQDAVVGHRPDGAVRLADGGRGLFEPGRIADPDRRRDGLRARHRAARDEGRRALGLAGEHPRGDARLAEALPVGGDVPAVADWERDPLGRPPKLLEHLERGRLLTLEAVRVDRVQERERAPLDQLAHEAQRIIE